MKPERILLVAFLTVMLGHDALGQTIIPFGDGWWLRFPFAPGTDLAGQTETNGMTWAAAGPTGPQISIAPNNLAVPGLVPPTGNRARLAGTNGPAARIGLGTNVTTGTLYYSLALRVADLGTLGTNGGVLAAFNNATGDSPNLPTPLVGRLLIRASAGGYQLGLSASSANAVDFWWWDDWFQPNDTVFVVCSYTFTAGPGNDTARLWINPSAANFGTSNAPAPTLTATADADVNQLSSLVLMQRPQPILPAVTFVDEVRVGTTWSSVTPTPPDQVCTGFAQGLPAGTISSGTTPPYVAGGVLHLTDAINDQGNFWTTPIPRQNVQSLRAYWKLLIGGGGDPNDGGAGADGLSFNLGTDLGTAFTAEEGAVNGLSVSVDTYDNGGAEVGLEIKWNGQRIGFARSGDGENSASAKAPLRRNNFFDVFLDVSYSGTVTFSYAGLNVSAQLPNYGGINANQYVFAARTGGAKDNHWIDDVCVELAGPWCTDFAQGLPAGTMAVGTTPPFVANGALHLTDTTNGQANYWITPIKQQVVQSLSAQWRTLIGGGGALGADGVSFNLGRDLGTSFMPEEGAGNGIGVTIDTWDNGGAEAGLEIKWNGQRLAFTRAGDGTTEAASPLRPNQFVDTTLEITPAGLATFGYAGFKAMAQLPDYVGVDANQYVFAARTGGANDNHWIDDLCIRLDEQPRADLKVALGAAPSQIVEGSPFTITVNASNAGPSTVTGVQLNATLPPGITWAAAMASQGSCSNTPNGVQCSLGAMQPGGTATISVVGIPDFNLLAALHNIPGLQEVIEVTNTVTIAAAEPDTTPLNNVAAVVVGILPLRDFGDAPQPPYPTLLPNGARHRIGALRFGTLIDAELNGLPVNLDDTTGVADEVTDGFGLPAGGVFAGGWTAINIQVSGPVGGYIDLWIDMDGAPGWGAADHVVVASFHPGGGAVVPVPMAIPAGAVTGMTWARARVGLNPAGLPPTGYGGAGEVVDFQINILPNPVAVFAGLEHVASGSATLTPGTSGLQIANLNSSNDMVRINLGRAEGWRGEGISFETLNDLSVAARGTIGSQSNKVLHSVHFDRAGSNVMVFVDFSGLGASHYRAEFYDRNGALLLARAPLGNGIPMIMAPCIGEDGSAGFKMCWVEVFANSISYRMCGDCITIDGIPVPGPGPIEVRLTAVTATGQADYLGAVEIGGAVGTSFTFSSEAIQRAGFWHHFLGDARLQAWPDDWKMPWFQVGNIGSSGQDGLLTELGRADALDVTLDAADLKAAGRVFRVRADGKAGALNGPLATLELAGNGNASQMVLNVALIPLLLDFSAWDGAQQVLNQPSVNAGAAMMLAPEQNGTVALQYFGVFKDPQSRLVVELEFAQPVIVAATGSSPVRASRVRYTTVGLIENLGSVLQQWSGFGTLGFFLFGRDYGDAPTGYPVTKAEFGARHRWAPSWRLGANWDREYDGTHSVSADYDDTYGIFGLPAAVDDEDGVAFLALTGSIFVQVTAAHDGFLDAWMDFNRDLDWTDLDEQILASEPLVAGVPRNFTITVPSWAAAGPFVSRWRLSETGGLTPNDYGGKGEVEDYVCQWQSEGPQYDFGDAPDDATFHYQTLLASGGAQHLIVPGWYLGTSIDVEPDGQPSIGATLDDTTALDDEDGITLPAKFVPGTMAAVLVTPSIAGYLDAWIDFNANRQFDAGTVEEIFTAQPVWPGMPALAFPVPTGSVLGGTYARFRFSSVGHYAPGGLALDGEVEDYAVTIDTGGGNNNPDGAVQFSDVPASTFANQPFTYSVTLSNAGAGRATGVALVVAHQGSVVAQPNFITSQGSCQVVSNQVRCALGQLDPGLSAIVRISVTPGPQEALRIEARATLAEVDGNLANNVAEQFVPVRPNVQPDCFCSCSTNRQPLTLGPMLGSWFTNGTRQYAQVRLKDGVPLATAWPGGPAPGILISNIYADIQKVEYSPGFVYVTANGLASHVMGPWECDLTEATYDFPNKPLDIHAINRIPLNPIVNSDHPVTPLGAMGIWVNGTAVYNMLDAFYYNPLSGGGDTRSPGLWDGGTLRGNWHRDAYFSERSTFDPAEYHSETDGEYHSHASPLLLRAQLGDNVLFDLKPSGEITNVREQTGDYHHSPILGWAFDGHPIYGPYGYSDPLDTNSSIARMRSGYTLRDGRHGTSDLRDTGRHTLPAWSVCMQGQLSQILAPGTWGPRPTNEVEDTGSCNGISWDLGRYVEDYAFLGDIDLARLLGAKWDLDRYNGRCCKTPEFPDGTYAYFVTLDTNGVPAFPYIIGWQYCSQTNGGVMGSITEATTVYFETTDVPRILSGPTFTGMAGSREISLVWSSLQGGTYHIETTEDLQTWTALTPSVTATGGTTEFKYPRPAPLPDYLFYRVGMDALAPYNMYLDPASGFGFRWPSSAAAGSTVTITIVLTTPAPSGAPLGAAIGNVMADSVSRTGDTVTATFTLPSGMSGSFPLAVGFPGPTTLTLNDGFIVK